MTIFFEIDRSRWQIISLLVYWCWAEGRTHTKIIASVYFKWVDIMWTVSRHWFRYWREKYTLLLFSWMNKMDTKDCSWLFAVCDGKFKKGFQCQNGGEMLRILYEQMLIIYRNDKSQRCRIISFILSLTLYYCTVYFNRASLSHIEIMSSKLQL